MTELLTKSLAKIVTENHKTANVFEKYQLDFCCKGKRTLQEACRENKINPVEVLSDLEMAILSENNEQTDPDTLSLSDLSEYIVSTHHSYVRNELPLIYGYLQKVTSKHGERHPELFKIFELFSAVKEEMEMHMQKEEKILFPRIAEIEKLLNNNAGLHVNKTFIAAPVSVMEQEHDHAGSMMAEIRELSNNYTPPPDACTTYKLSFAALESFERDLHRHVHLENNILFLKALRLFGIPGEPSLN